MQRTTPASRRAAGRVVAVGLLGLVLGPARAAEALEPPGFQSARLLSMADSLRAGATTHDAIFVNPAGLALGRVYSVEANAQDDLVDVDTFLNASIVDSQAGPIAAGISYTYLDRKLGGDGDDARKRLAHRVDVAVGTRIAESAALGVTLRYITLSEQLGGVDVEDAGYNLFTVDAGLQWALGGGLRLGLAGYNLTHPDNVEQPLSWGAGLGWGGEAFSIEADVRYNAQVGNPRFSGAVAYVLGQIVPVRVGVAWDRRSEALWVSGGIGYQDANFGADVGYRERVVQGTVADTEPGKRMLAFALRLVFM